MSRYYFDCPIKALYMTKEFGVKFDNLGSLIQDLEGYKMLTLLPKFVADCRSSKKHYIVGESESIFSPKNGDTMITQQGNYADCFGTNPEGFLGQIILRNEKHFFAPLIEND